MEQLDERLCRERLQDELNAFDRLRVQLSRQPTCSVEDIRRMESAIVGHVKQARSFDLRMFDGKERDFAHVLIKTCFEYDDWIDSRFGDLAVSLIYHNQLYASAFYDQLVDILESLEQYRNVKRMVAMLIFKLFERDSLPWHFFLKVKLTENDSSAKLEIFKYFFTELLRVRGLQAVKDKFQDLYTRICCEFIVGNTRASRRFLQSVNMEFLIDQ